jgi:hypothetical protein
LDRGFFRLDYSPRTLDRQTRLAHLLLRAKSLRLLPGARPRLDMISISDACFIADCYCLNYVHLIG